MVETVEQTKKKTGNGKKAIIAICVGILVVALGFAGVGYFTNYYEAMDYVDSYVEQAFAEKDYYVFTPADGSKTDQGIIFYPGGKVEETAYAPLCQEVANAGYQVYLVKMPVHLAVFGKDKGADVMKTETEIAHWYMMGHSLGGAMAAAFAGEHTDEIEGLILLGAYSTADLSSSDMKVLTIYGENDQVLDREKYEENRSNLPKKTTEYIIEGGNHAYFGAYGSQDGDGEATITQEEQMQQVVDLVLQW
ncbi:MAG: alpha/beta hydrolase [Agathobacter sp.]|nr:alpha/beta hydrolase [Agathobacter sp.]